MMRLKKTEALWGRSLAVGSAAAGSAGEFDWSRLHPLLLLSLLLLLFLPLLSSLLLLL